VSFRRESCAPRGLSEVAAEVRLCEPLIIRMFSQHCVMFRMAPVLHVLVGAEAVVERCTPLGRCMLCRLWTTLS
jgi:hypothetical protein